ncbi:hypothetical protein BH09BAC4_BH09BAC4_03060 [soil metagenome]
MLYSMKHYFRLPVGLLLIISFDQCKQPSVPVPAKTTPTRDDNMALGDPNGARSLESSSSAYLIPSLFVIDRFILAFVTPSFN